VVTFDRSSVVGCAYLGSLGSAVAGTSIAPGFLGTFPSPYYPDAVYIETFNSAGTLTDEPFSLAVFC